MQNVRKAISRYGTLPKGARIGAYLESLRQSGMSTNEETSAPTSQETETTPRSVWNQIVQSGLVVFVVSGRFLRELTSELNRK